MSSGNKVIVKYVAETTQGTTPASALTKLNVVSTNINPTINTTVSAQISTTRATLDSIRTDGATAGDIGFEGQYSTYDPFWESALGGTFNAGQTLTATDISAANGDNSFNSLATAFSTSAITPGSVIKVKGFTNAANNGTFVVVSATTAKVVVSGGTLTTEAAGNSVTVSAKDLRDGVTPKYFTIEEEFSDLTTTFAAYKGMVVNTASLDANVGNVVSGTFGLMGMTTTYGTATVGTGAEVSASVNEVWSPVGSIGTIYENGTALSGVCVTRVNLSTNNNFRDNRCLGSLYASSTPIGSFSAQVDVELYFNSTALLTKFVNGTETSLRWQFTDSTGNVFSVYCPSVKFNTGSLAGIQKDSDVSISLQGEILYDSTLGFALQISSLVA